GIGLAEAVPQAKYLKFEGADGLTYVLAVQEGNNLLTQVAEANIAEPTQITQNASAVKTPGAGKKRLSNSSRIQAQTSSTTSSSSSSSQSSSSRGKSSHNASVDGINQAWFTTKDDKDALHMEGLKWKQGQWTKEEVEILEENINSYCKEHNIKDPADVIFERSKEERKDFYRTVALGIQRPLFSVYRRVTRMYDRKNHRGKYTTTEMRSLRSLRAKHGNDWAAIGVALGRSASSVKDKCRLMKDNCNSGKWYPEEEARLAAAVHKLTGVKPSESITSGLSWAVVADHVGTRSEKQCRTKWLNYLNWKQQGGADWTREDDNLLIERVSKMNVFSDSEIDWVALSKDWASVRSPQWLRGKWWALKRHIPDYNKLSYPALLEQMKQVIFWNMKPKAGTLRQSKTDLDGPASSAIEFFKNVIPVSVGNLSDGSLSLTYCPSEEEGYQAFEVLQSWTPQILSSVTQAGPDAGGEGMQGILSEDGSQIIVQALGPNESEGIHLCGQQQVIISTAGLDGQVTDGSEREAMAIQVDGDGLAHHTEVQDLNVLTSDGLHENTFTTDGEEIVTVAEFQTEVEEAEQDMMTQDVFETVTSEAGGDLVMGISSPTAASSLMTSLKDPILMSSSDVDCEKCQNAELTDEID
ncbi:cyclin-D-binding Myb-like transcription factor 1, partial [Elysia marginata]